MYNNADLHDDVCNEELFFNAIFGILFLIILDEIPAKAHVQDIWFIRINAYTSAVPGKGKTNRRALDLRKQSGHAVKRDCWSTYVGLLETVRVLFDCATRLDERPTYLCILYIHLFICAHVRPAAVSLIRSARTLYRTCVWITMWLLKFSCGSASSENPLPCVSISYGWIWLGTSTDIANWMVK